MKKQFLNLGKALSKAEQKQINGGKKEPIDCTDQCSGDSGCYMGYTCKTRYCAGKPDWHYCG